MQSNVGTIVPASPGHHRAQMCQMTVSILYTPRDEWTQMAHSHMATGLRVVPMVPPFTITFSSSSSPPLSHLHLRLPPFATLHPSWTTLTTSSIPPLTPGAKFINLAVLIGSDFILLCRGSSSGSDQFSLFSLEGAERANLDLDLEFLNV